MRIVHLGASDFNGAGAREALALHEQLLSRGVQSSFLAKECFLKGTERIAATDPIILAQLTQKICFDQNLAHDFASGFTLGFPGSGSPAAQALNEADIIHLHDVAGLLSPQFINRLLATGKPVVWSLPDMWPFTGGCHYAPECDKYKADCQTCPQLKSDPYGLPAFLLDKKQRFFKAPNLHLIAPNQWLAQSATASRVLGERPVHRMGPAKSDALCPLPKQEAKARLGLAPDAFTLLLICEKTGRRERCQRAIQQLLAYCASFRVLARLARANRLRIVILGDVPANFHSEPGVIAAGNAGDYQRLSTLLSAADLAVLPHFEENSSHLFAEAAACGTPLMAMNTAGATEVIRDGVNGKLIPLWDLRRMAEEICYFALRPPTWEAWEKGSFEAYAQLPKDSVDRHLALYNELLAARPSAASSPVAEISSRELYQELYDLLPVLIKTLDASVAAVHEEALACVATVEQAAAPLQKALEAAITKIAVAEERINTDLRHGTLGPKLKQGIVSIGKLRTSFIRTLRDRKAEEARQKDQPLSSFPVVPKKAEPGPQKPLTKGERFLKWAYEKHLAKRHLTKPGVLEQYPPRPMVLEKFPRAHVAARKLPTIAIVTPSYMQGRFIEATVRSVIDQDYPKLRYAVQDAGSTDETVEILKKHSGRITTWVSEPDTGQARAVASGFEKISGDVMGWLNSDDLLMPGALRFVGEYFQKHPGVDVIYGHRVIVNEFGKEIGRWVMPPHDPEVLRSADYVPQETLFWRQSLWNKTGGISPNFHFALDWDLLLRFQQAGANIKRVPYFLGCFRVHTLQKTSAQMETIGSEEVNYLRSKTPGSITDLRKLGDISLKVTRQSAMCDWLLRWGIRW